jgi:hypothetical protein
MNWRRKLTARAVDEREQSSLLVVNMYVVVTETIAMEII